jgi:hypothetical protein
MVRSVVSGANVDRDIVCWAGSAHLDETGIPENFGSNHLTGELSDNETFQEERPSGKRSVNFPHALLAD